MFRQLRTGLQLPLWNGFLPISVALSDRKSSTFVENTGSQFQVLAETLIPLIPFSMELQQIRETIETVAEDRNRL